MTRLVLSELFVTNLLLFEHQQKRQQSKSKEKERRREKGGKRETDTERDRQTDRKTETDRQRQGVNIKLQASFKHIIYRHE